MERNIENNGYPYMEDDLESDRVFFEKMFNAMEEDDRNQISPEKKEKMLRKISFALQLENAEKRRAEQHKQKEGISHERNVNEKNFRERF